MARKRKRKQIPYRLNNTSTMTPLSTLLCISFEQYIKLVQDFYNRQIEYFRETAPGYLSDETIADLEARKRAVEGELGG